MPARKKQRPAEPDDDYSEVTVDMPQTVFKNKADQFKEELNRRLHEIMNGYRSSAQEIKERAERDILEATQRMSCDRSGEHEQLARLIKERDVKYEAILDTLRNLKHGISVFVDLCSDSHRHLAEAVGDSFQVVASGAGMPDDQAPTVDGPK